MARDNFVWGAPRIQGELLMLGFTVSQATISRYLPSPGRRPPRSWRRFLRNQANAFARYSEHRSEGYAPHCRFWWATVRRWAAAQLAKVSVGFRRSVGRRPTVLNARMRLVWSAQCERVAVCRLHPRVAASSGLQRSAGRLARGVTTRCRAHEARASPEQRSCATRGVALP